MKKITVFLLLACMYTSTLWAQGFISQDIANRTLYPVSNIEGFNKNRMRNNNQRSVRELYLSYVNADGAYADFNGFPFTFLTWEVNKRRASGPPTDTSGNFTCKWVAVQFDSLYDLIEEVSYPYANSNITVDSIELYLNHTNTTGNEDSIWIRVLEKANSPSGFLSGNGGITLTNVVLWDTLILTTQPLIPNLAANTVGAILFPCGATIPTGQKFSVQVEFSGDTANKFEIADFNRFDCGLPTQNDPNLSASETIFPNNSWRYFNLFIPASPPNPANNLSGLGGLVLNGNPEGCDLYYFQNIGISVVVTADIPLSVSVAQNNIVGCPGDQVSLVANAVGGTGPYDYSWSNGQSGAAINVPVSNTTETYTVTVTDADSEVRTATVTVTSQGIGIDLGADRTLDCGQTTNLSPLPSGNVLDAKYIWSTGDTTLNLANVNAGTYSVTVSNSAGCSASDNIVISLPNSNQALNFNSPSQHIRSCPLEITNQSINTVGWNFEWNFGDGALSILKDPTHTWSSLGIFVITLVADSFDCKVTRTKNIQIINGTCQGVGIDEQLLNNISIYPNPTNGKFVVTLESVAGNAVVNVLNMNGQVVVSEKFNATGNDSKEIDLANFSNGLYLVNIQVDGKIASKTILKQ